MFKNSASFTCLSNFPYFLKRSLFVSLAIPISPKSTKKSNFLKKNFYRVRKQIINFANFVKTFSNENGSRCKHHNWSEIILRGTEEELSTVFDRRNTFSKNPAWCSGRRCINFDRVKELNGSYKFVNLLISEANDFNHVGFDGTGGRSPPGWGGQPLLSVAITLRQI